MEEPKGRRVRLFGDRLILKIAASALAPVALVAGLGFFWEYREDRNAVEALILHEMREEALALAAAIGATREQADLQTIVSNFLRNIGADSREVFGGLIELGLSKIFVVDASGVVLAGGRPEIIGQPIMDALGHGPMGLPAVLDGRQAYAAEFTVGNDRKVVHISVPLRIDRQDPAGVTGAVHVMEPYALMEEALLPGIWRRTSVAVALVLALVAALSLILGLVVVVPVRRLAEGMRRAQEGLDVTVPVTSRDEIGNLTRSFNEMVADLHRKRGTLATLYAIERTVSQSLDLEVVLTQTLEKVCEVMAVEAGGYYLLEPDGETMVLRVHRGLPSTFAEAVRRIRVGEGVSGQAIAFRRPVAMAMADYPTPRLAPILVALGIKHMASALVIARDRVIGAINVGSRRERPFTEEELELLGSIGQQVGASVENAQLHDVTARQAHRLAMLTELSRSLTMALEPAAVAQEILRAVQALIPGSAGRLWERVGDEDVLNVAASIGLRDPRGGQRLRFYPGEGLTGIAAATRRPVISPDVTHDPRFVNQAWAAAEGLVSCIVLPLLYGERIHGGLAIFTREPHTFTDEEVGLLRSFAAQAAIAIENARLFEHVRAGRERLEWLTQQLISAQEEERRRLSRELHDEAGQALIVLKITIELIRADVPVEFGSLRQRLSETVAMTEAAMEQIRRLAQDLRPPGLDAAGLDSTLEGLCQDFAGRTRLSIRYVGADLPALPDAVTTCLYRFLQEALANVVKHAHANLVHVALRNDGETISLSVEDDGLGFDVQAAMSNSSQRTGIGLMGLQERFELLGGRVKIESQPGQGTHLAAHVPWKGVE